jgi:hypothetical protein
MICPHCKCKIEAIIAPQKMVCYLAFCSVCRGVVKVEDNEIKQLSILDNIEFENYKYNKIRSAQLN